MGQPTVYKIPSKVLPPQKIDERTKELWKKHRESRGKDPKLPKLKK